MGIVRVQLKKSWTNEFNRSYGIGTVLQLIPSVAKELIENEIGVEYKGEYPPKEKVKIDLKQLKNK